MLLAVDIGNTAITFAVMRGQRVIKVYLLDAHRPWREMQAELTKVIKRISQQHRTIEQALLCSVVPNILTCVQRKIRSQLKIPVHVIGRDIKVPIKNKYRNPKQVGQDRLVCAYAAKQLYGAPAIVIDLGTAITFDVVSKSGSYEGGMIVPGIRLSTETLFQKTALLPRIKSITAPRQMIGKNTQGSILSGVFYGYGAMCRGLIDQLGARIKGKPNVILTGGYTHLMTRFIAKKITKIDQHLIFKGLALLACE